MKSVLGKLKLVRCKTCHYSLANLTERRCPECGLHFDPRDSRTFETAESRRIQMRRWRIKVAVYALWTIPAIYGLAINVSRPRPEAPIILIASPLVIAYFWFDAYKTRPR
jgi:hypothetical protein